MKITDCSKFFSLQSRCKINDQQKTVRYHCKITAYVLMCLTKMSRGFFKQRILVVRDENNKKFYLNRVSAIKCFKQNGENDDAVIGRIGRLAGKVFPKSTSQKDKAGSDLDKFSPKNILQKSAGDSSGKVVSKSIFQASDRMSEAEFLKKMKEGFFDLLVGKLPGSGNKKQLPGRVLSTGEIVGPSRMGLINFEGGYANVCWLNSALQHFASQRSEYYKLLFDGPDTIRNDITAKKQTDIGDYVDAFGRAFKGREDSPKLIKNVQGLKRLVTCQKEASSKTISEIATVRNQLQKFSQRLGGEIMALTGSLGFNREESVGVTYPFSTLEKKLSFLEGKSNCKIASLREVITLQHKTNQLERNLNIEARHKKLLKFRDSFRSLVNLIHASTLSEEEVIVAMKDYSQFVEMCKKEFRADAGTRIGRDTRDSGEFISTILDLFGFPIPEDSPETVSVESSPGSDEVTLRHQQRKSAVLGAGFANRNRSLTFQEAIEQPEDVGEGRTQKYVATHLPQTLLISLNRTAYDATGRQVKIGHPILLGAEVILTEYKPTERDPSKLVPSKQCTYRIESAIKHLGNHYTYHQRVERGGGKRFSDTHITDESQEALNRSFSDGTFFHLELIRKDPVSARE